MAAITVTNASRGVGGQLGAAGLTAASAADTFPPGDDIWLRVQITKASPVTVTVTPSAGGGPHGTTVAPLDLAPDVEANTGDRLYGPFPQVPFASAADGQVHVTYDPAPAAGDVKVQVLRLAAS